MRIEESHSLAVGGRDGKKEAGVIQTISLPPSIGLPKARMVAWPAHAPTDG